MCQVLSWSWRLRHHQRGVQILCDFRRKTVAEQLPIVSEMKPARLYRSGPTRRGDKKVSQCYSMVKVLIGDLMIGRVYARWDIFNSPWKAYKYINSMCLRVDTIVLVSASKERDGTLFLVSLSIKRDNSRSCFDLAWMAFYTAYFAKLQLRTMSK